MKIIGLTWILTLMFGTIQNSEKKNNDKLLGKWKLTHNVDNEYMDFFEGNLCDFHFIDDDDTLIVKGEYYLLQDVLAIKLANSETFDEYMVNYLDEDSLSLTFKEVQASYKKVQQ